MQQNYAECIRRVLLSEGGYTNNPSDPGGPTNWGITIWDARLHWKPNATAEDVRDMPREVALGIYKSKYWDALRCDELPSGVDYSVFDYGVNSGIGRSGRVLRAVLGLPQNDWHVTDEVLAALKTRDTVHVVDAINTERMAFLMALKTWPVFGHGWSVRVVSVKAFSEHLAKTAVQTPAPAPQAPEHPEVPPHGKAYEDKDSSGDIVADVVHEMIPSWLIKKKDEAPAPAPEAPKEEPHEPRPPSMWRSKSGWIATGIGGLGGLQVLQQLNDYAEQLQSAISNLSALHLSGTVGWVMAHPGVLVPIALVAMAAFVWADHRKYKRLLYEAQKPK